MKNILLLAIFFLFFLAPSCSGGKAEKEPVVNNVPVPADTARLIKILSPGERKVYRTKTGVDVSLAPVSRNRVPDSVIISFNGTRLARLESEPWNYQVPAAEVSSTGKKPLKATAWKDGKAQSVTRFIEVYSSVTPKVKGYRVVNTFPHSRDAFTQGLFFNNGLLYEGTGQETGSSLREVELETGKVLRQVNLESSLFGEGITLLGDRIFQVTWENKVGFVYEKSTFKLLRKITYPTQGWGLTTLSDRIVMSDGTNVLYFYEPEMFTVTSRLEVYDNDGPVESLNELEYINGEIWANIWMKDLIARIDPSSGEVLGYIDLGGILPEADKDSETDVLNGIAYDAGSKRIFVTGKKWPKLFEVRITE